MFQKVLRSPVLYFDKTPTGRIINKFSNDIGLLDVILGSTANDGVEGIMYYLNLIITVCTINPFILIPIVI